ncbi:MAG: ribbon-helix-helix protein, CopG family [Nitrospirae bacterium]|nr:ribbon-helix-helix protein, CopG family [Candidatus Troglogloeales bacterium]
MRTIVDLPKEQLQVLSSLCEKEKISRAEAIRRAVNKLLAEASVGSLESAFGIWKHKKLSSRQYVERLRLEWSDR